MASGGQGNKYIVIVCSLITVHVVQCTHNGVDTFATELALFTDVYHRIGVVGAYDAPSLFLHVRRGLPWIVDVFGGVVAQFGDVRLDKGAVEVHLLPDEARVKTLDLVAEEAGARALHPADGRDGELEIEHVLVEEIFPQDPGDPQVATGEEHSDALTCHEMGPAVFTTLAHNGVDPRVSGPPLTPSGEEFVVGVPRKLDAERVALHDVKLGRR